MSCVCSDDCKKKKPYIIAAVVIVIVAVLLVVGIVVTAMYHMDAYKSTFDYYDYGDYSNVNSSESSTSISVSGVSSGSQRARFRNICQYLDKRFKLCQYSVRRRRYQRTCRSIFSKPKPSLFCKDCRELYCSRSNAVA